MKKYSWFFLILFLFSSLAFADRKSRKESQEDILEAQKAIKKVEGLKVFEFPYELGRAKYYLQLAEESLSDGNRDNASYYADLAFIYAQTAFHRSKTKTLSWQRLQEELELWKSIAEENEGDVAKKVKKLEKEIAETRINYAVMNSGFESADNIKTLALDDLESLIKITFSIKETAPVSFFDFLKMLSWIPEAQFKIQGHTSYLDRDMRVSTAKAEGLKALLITMGIDESKIHIEGLGNTQAFVINGKAIKGPRNNRIELKVQKGDESLQFVWQDNPFWIRRGGTWSANPRAVLTLSSLRELFTLIPGLEVEVQGHTARIDNSGESLAKAMLMKDYLAQKGGVPASRINVEGLGNTKPLMNGARPVVGVANNRLEMVLKKEDFRQSFVFADRVLLLRGALSIRLSEAGNKNLQEVVKEIVKQRIPKSRIVVEAHTAYVDARNVEGLLKGNLYKDLLAEALKIPPSDFTLTPRSNRSPLKVNGVPVRGPKNNRVEVLFSVGKKYILQIKDHELFLKKSFMISDKGKSTLDKVHELFAMIPKAKLIIEGHTATRDINSNISKSKAEAVRDYFLNIKGVSNDRLTLFFHGNAIPLEVGGRPIKGWQNNRVSLIIEIPKENQ